MAVAVVVSARRRRQELSDMAADALDAVWERVKERGLRVSYLDLYNTFRRYDREGVEWAYFDPETLDYSTVDAFWQSLYVALERIAPQGVSHVAREQIELYVAYMAKAGAWQELEALARDLEREGERGLAAWVRDVARRVRAQVEAHGQPVATVELKPARLPAAGKKGLIAEALLSLPPGAYPYRELLERVNRYLTERGYGPTNITTILRVARQLQSRGLRLDRRRGTIYILSHGGAIQTVALAY